MAVEFNRQLKDRVNKLRAELPLAALTYVDVYTAKYGLISNTKNQDPPDRSFCETKLGPPFLLFAPPRWSGSPLANAMVALREYCGFTDPLKICCGHHKNDVHVWCGQKDSINGTQYCGASCATPSTFISWDGVHYSEAANHWAADCILNGA
ncbi:hypothetical protein RHSIM_Rhsim10G0017300 [Rhododendron simsii]|uniref:GDSL esterase/lipase n=1 Tax=Rhododendron simsii TaxID=118357 RepID=A0A834LA04_RHOSS|nr:hypothetical protein RHSIM_Rhsim10G0017300 [Rhododendron simsii]